LPDLKQHLVKFASKPPWEQLADFHLLLFLSDRLDFRVSCDMEVLVWAIREKGAVEVPAEFMKVSRDLVGLTETKEFPFP
jgi:hypothetical protein